MLTDKFDKKAEVKATSKQLKNLILLQLESYPNEFVKDPRISPHLNNLSKIYEFISPISSQPYTTWTFSGMLLTQTGLPQIFPNFQFQKRTGNTDYLYEMNIKGIPDILSSYNYTLNYLFSYKNEIMGIGKWIRHHKYNTIYNPKNDLYLFNYLSDEYLPKIDKIIRDSNMNKHFLSYIINSNTHSPYNRPKWCKLNLHDLQEYQKCFYCIDFALNNFFKKFIELKMYEHTLLVVYPDHRPHNLNFNELFILFPGKEKVDSNLKIKGEITYYDFAPTILDLIGISSYNPVFPFGRSIYLNSKYNQKYCDGDICIQRHAKPDSDDLSMIYRTIHFEHGKNIHSYNISSPFICRIQGSNDTYYSNNPCKIH